MKQVSTTEVYVISKKEFAEKLGIDLKGGQIEWVIPTTDEQSIRIGVVHDNLQ